MPVGVTVVTPGRPDEGRPVVVRDPLRRRLGRRGGSSPIIAPGSPRTVLETPRGDPVLVRGPGELLVLGGGWGVGVAIQWGKFWLEVRLEKITRVLA